MFYKKCSMCGVPKELEYFLFRNKNKGLRHSACSECYKEVRKKSYEKNKKYYINKNKRLLERNKDWYLNFKSKQKCCCCNESDIAVLDFHHLNDKEKEISKMVYDNVSIKKLMDEINKCIVLCSNCHRKLHYYNYTIDELKKMPL